MRFRKTRIESQGSFLFVQRLLRFAGSLQQRAQVIMGDPAILVFGNGVTPERFVVSKYIGTVPTQYAKKNEKRRGDRNQRRWVAQNVCYADGDKRNETDTRQILEVIGHKRVAEGIEGE